MVLFRFFRGSLKSYSKILKAARRAAKNSGVFGIFLDSVFFSDFFSGVPKSEKKVWSPPIDNLHRSTEGIEGMPYGEAGGGVEKSL